MAEAMLRWSSRGRGMFPFVEPGWGGDGDEPRKTDGIPVAPCIPESGVVGVDRGKIPLAVFRDVTQTMILDGRQNKLKAIVDTKDSRFKKSSRRRRMLEHSERLQLPKLDHQVADIAHK